MSTQNVNVARFARNVECEFFCDFQTLCFGFQVLKHLEDLREVEDYLKFVGRLHDVAGVDPRFLDVTGLAFCHALHHLDHKSLHGDIWNSQVKETWQTFFRVVVRSMKKGYAGYNASGDHRSFSKNQLVLFNEQKSLITEVSQSIMTSDTLKGIIHDQ